MPLPKGFESLRSTASQGRRPLPGADERSSPRVAPWRHCAGEPQEEFLTARHGDQVSGALLLLASSHVTAAT